MASAMRKMAVYLGLVEGEHRYDDQYQDEFAAEEYEEYGAEFIDAGDPRDLNGHAEAARSRPAECPSRARPPRRPSGTDHGSRAYHHTAPAYVQ